MSKKDWFEAWLKTRMADITITHRDTGIAWAGFWVGLGIVLAAQIIVGGEVVIR